MKCSKCGTTIKNVYYVDGKPYGCECFKSVLNDVRKVEAKKHNELREVKLAELKAKKELEFIKELEENKARSIVGIEMLKTKNMKRITNQYKLNMYNEILEQFKEYGSLNNYYECKLRELFLITKKDNITYYNMYFEISSDEELINIIPNLYNYNSDLEDIVKEKIEDLKSKYDMTIMINEDHDLITKFEIKEA